MESANYLSPKSMKRSLSQYSMLDIRRQSFLWQEFLYIVLFMITCVPACITISIYTLIFATIWFIKSLLLVRKPSKPPKNWFNPRFPNPVFKEKTVTTEDGYKLAYRITENISLSIDNKVKKSKKIMLLACPLGQCGPSIYYPLLCHLGIEDWIYITWDYRGFWGSSSIDNDNEYETQDRIREISIFEFARDANVILLNENIKCVDVMLGHSMGVQVTLEFAVLYPKKLKSMILINGSHGTVFHTAFQPMIRLPFVGDMVAEFVAFCTRHKEILEYMRRFTFSPAIKAVINAQTLFFGNEKLRKRFGDDYWTKFLHQYYGNICKDTDTMYKYIRCFQELHSHSVLHLLDRVDTPTLIISGFWDPLLCALSSYEMAKKLKYCRHVCDLWSSHATMLENPEPCVYEIMQFLNYMDIRHFQTKLD